MSVVALSRAGSRKWPTGPPAPLRLSLFLLSLRAPLSTTPTLAHRSTSARSFSFEIDRRHTCAAQAAGALALLRFFPSPSTHPSLDVACARPLSRCHRLSSQLPKVTRASQHVDSTERARARARALGLSLFVLFVLFDGRCCCSSPSLLLPRSNARRRRRSTAPLVCLDHSNVPVRWARAARAS